MNKIYLLAAAIFAASSVQAENIPLTNGDFAAGVQHFGGFDSGPDIPGWSDYGTVADGGAENPGAWWGAYNGGYSAFIANGTGAYNTSAHTIQAGEVFTVGFVGKGWFGPSQIKITLFYNTPGTPGAPPNVIGTFTQDVTGTWTQYYSR
jgi:hypothetical protein